MRIVALSDNNWHIIGVYYSNTSQNGFTVIDGQYTSQSIGKTFIPNCVSLRVGNRQENSNQLFDGLIDNIFIWHDLELNFNQFQKLSEDISSLNILSLPEIVSPTNMSSFENEDFTILIQ